MGEEAGGEHRDGSFPGVVVVVKTIMIVVEAGTAYRAAKCD